MAVKRILYQIRKSKADQYFCTVTLYAVIQFMQQPVAIIEIIVIFLLGLWLVANIVYALFNKQVSAFTYHRDVFRWLSAYQLFSDTPREYTLLYRDRLADNSLTGWTTIPLIPAWKPWHLIWYPQKEVPLTVYSMVDDVAEGIKEKKERAARSNISERFIYRMLLHYVYRFPVPAGAAGRQFRIEQANQAIFISDFHQP